MASTALAVGLFALGVSIICALAISGFLGRLQAIESILRGATNDRAFSAGAMGLAESPTVAETPAAKSVALLVSSTCASCRDAVKNLVSIANEYGSSRRCGFEIVAETSTELGATGDLSIDRSVDRYVRLNPGYTPALLMTLDSGEVIARPTGSRSDMTDTLRRFGVLT
jgi:hypothetical protein